ncbi:RloB family protein [Actinacidiphila sp. ITFR-21]|uniref:RloB family protein n=1 Tax=Actinacidiphila sp. ITFR-21 TaxID=3075199 RepID=UPI00288ADE00|nr:RloB family protein [Streptomyces sp. ITFR-21]WNI17041.1 RloB family protein [Streptomyces sp. ITFR-21]
MSGRQLRGSQKIAKSKQKRNEHRKILIATEGVNTEPQYFERFAALLKAKAVRVVSLKPVGVGRDPLSVVKEADRRSGIERRAGDPFDEVWCVVDVDEHATLQRACAEAGRLRIDMAISAPSFEIWLLWHFEDRMVETDARTLSRTLKRKWGFSDKSMPDGFPYAEYDSALKRAGKCEEVRVRHAPPNPSSSVSSLVEALIKVYTEENRSHDSGVM